MKIFLSFLQSKVQHPIPAYSFWEFYIKNGIEEAGYEWIECDEVDWAKGLVPQTKEELADWKSYSWEKTLRYLKNNTPDVFLSYLYPNQIDIDAINSIKKLGIQTINFFCDHVRLFTKLPKEFEVFDKNWVPEYKAIPLYQKAKLPYFNLPMPMWVDPKYRAISEYEHDEITFIGSKDIQRQLFFEDVLTKDNNFDIKIYGNGWQSTKSPSPKQTSIIKKIGNQFSYLNKHGIGSYFNKIKQNNFNALLSLQLTNALQSTLDFNDYIKKTRESKIVLGINRYPSFNFPLHKPNTYSRLRDIEAPMLGACYLTEWTAGLDHLYDINHEILTFKTSDELIENCKRLSNDKQLRIRIKTAGQQKALNEHSIPSILNKLIG
ncbi:glycosyltransferase [Pedobacter sp. LMG 31464]|uniref:Glycosyltransferase n=1 Tax=Pedobacter planticolens TaxID=2679964 RepID=A0A923DY78_9SPHI|nr:glycosyltransferase [Pedobacter planticolens]MBB2144097.1 glycosyltransferase [Pedobacter planticolens]